MNRAFLFDMDGVLIDSESLWGRFEAPMLERLLGKEIAQQVAGIPGVGIGWVYERAKAAGSRVSKEQLMRGFESIFPDVYANAPASEGAGTLITALLKDGYRLGLVTQTPRMWVDRVLSRAPFQNTFETVISLHDHPELRLKPAPDGYIEALKQLDADARSSFVLEDSTPGIRSGKAAGCFVIGYRGNLEPGYVQEGADAYADTMGDVISILEQQGGTM